jgi:hypothetical protein
MGAEVDEHRRLALLALDIENGAKTVLVVRHQVLPLVHLDGFLDDRDIEGTSWQVPSAGASARWLHLINSTRIADLMAALARSNVPGSRTRVGPTCPRGRT